MSIPAATFVSTRGPAGAGLQVDVREYVGEDGRSGKSPVDGQISAALSQLSGTGYRLYCPPGTYMCDASVFGSSNVNVIGEGRGTRFKASPGRTTGAIFNFDNCSHFTVEGIYFDGDYQSIAYNFKGNNCVDGWFKYNYTKGNPFSDQSVSTSQWLGGGIIGNVIEQADRDGIDFSGEAMIVGWNRFVNDPTAPVGLDKGDDMLACAAGLVNGVIIGNILDNPKHARGRGMWLRGLQNVTIIANVGRYCFRAFILLEDSATVPMDGVDIIGNSADLIGYNHPGGFAFGNGIHILLDEGASGNPGTSKHIRRLTFKGNKIRNCVKSGMWIENTTTAGILEDVRVDDTYFNDPATLGADAAALQDGTGSAIKCTAPSSTVKGLRVEGGSYSGFPGATQQVNVSGTNVTDFHHERDAKHASTLANGVNNDVPAPAGYLRVTGPSAAFSITSITLPAEARRVVIYNATSQQMTLVHEAGTGTATNRIHVPDGVSRVSGGESIAELIYDTVLARWVLIPAFIP